MGPGKTIGTTNLIMLDSSNRELFNAPVVVTDSTKSSGRVTLHATAGRGGLQKFYVYRCPPRKLCELVKEPEVIVRRDVPVEETGQPEAPQR
jgi:hypothetical protein